VPAALQRKGAQLLLPPSEQLPTPAHRSAIVSVEPVQLAGAHTVPTEYVEQAPAPLQVPVVSHELGGSSGHSPSGSVAFAIGPQEPSTPAPRSADVHATHVLPHAESQHTPSTQKPLPQSPGAAHRSPLAPGVRQIPIGTSHVLPNAQSAFTVHVVRQAVPLAAQAYAPHDVTPPSTHIPVPLHVSARVSTPPAHDAGAQTVPPGWSAHAPEPLQAPVVEQVAAASAAHSMPGSFPTKIGPHVPFAAPPPRSPAVQASQVPPHAALQQTPSTQKPLAHSPPRMQA
jgi:hypothetical protein